ncbi:MAG TPA: hypothetical protein VMZ50_11425 [Phycisphaerae bacterium]|nr:hypothetical protein [Phycisphaerae bacterium]
MNEEQRVGAVKLIVALLPDSAETILSWVKSKTGRGVHEVQFTLFCFLDQARFLPGAERFAIKVPQIVEDYLNHVRAETSQAAWMAGDLLGDHLPVSDGLPVLLRSARSAKFVAGRAGALHGLEHVLGRLKVGSYRSNRVVTLLREISVHDKSLRLRAIALYLLEEERKREDAAS